MLYVHSICCSLAVVRVQDKHLLFVMVLLGVKKHVTKKEAMDVFKKKSLANSVPENEELPTDVQFPEEFLAFMQKVKGKMDEVKTLVAQEVPILKMALRSLPNDKLNEVKDLMQEAIRGCRGDTSEARFFRVLEVLFPSMSILNNAQKELNNIQNDYQRYFLLLFIDNYSEASGSTVKHGNSRFLGEIITEIDRRRDEQRMPSASNSDDAPNCVIS